MSDYEVGDRRPIASRKLSWVKRLTGLLVRLRISPNLISVMSVVFAALGAACALGTTLTGSPLAARALWIGLALCVQLRLLANLFDGMVAVESKTASRLGELFNELPDRVSDTLLLVSLGFAAGSSPHLGYAAALLAMFGAYLRAVGASVGAGQIFDGLMAKPQRMFVVTVLALVMAFSPASWAVLAGGLGPVALALALISAGCVLTAATRLIAIGRKLQEGAHVATS